MDFQHEYQQQFHLAEQARLNGSALQSVAILDEMHSQYHDRAWIHVKVHFEAARAHACLKNYSQVLFHLGVIIFAPPASWAQKYLKLSRKNI